MKKQVQNLNKSDLAIHLSRKFSSLNDETIIEGIDISTKNAATEAATVIADARKQIKFRNAYLASKELALLDSLNNISTQTASSKLLINDLPLQETVRQLKKLDVLNAIIGDVQKAKYLLNSGLLQLI